MGSKNYNSIKTIFIDLDNTIYEKERGLLTEVSRRIDLFISSRFRDIKNIGKYRTNLFYKYGTTLKGLMIEKNVNPEEYLRFVNNINIEDFLERDEELIKVISGIEQEKMIFTNSPREYALNVLEVLGIEKFFSDIIDIRYLDFIPKPSEEAFKKLFKGRIRPEESMIADDYEHNLKPAKKFGMTTVLVGNDKNTKYPHVDYYINKIIDIKKIL